MVDGAVGAASARTARAATLMLAWAAACAAAAVERRTVAAAPGGRELEQSGGAWPAECTASRDCAPSGEYCCCDDDANPMDYSCEPCAECCADVNEVGEYEGGCPSTCNCADLTFCVGTSCYYPEGCDDEGCDA